MRDKTLRIFVLVTHEDCTLDHGGFSIRVRREQRCCREQRRLNNSRRLVVELSVHGKDVRAGGFSFRVPT